MNENLVTIKQAEALKNIGFDEMCTRYAYRFNEDEKFILQSNLVHIDNNAINKYNKTAVLSIPTIDEAIDWIRRKFNVMIYNTAAPFVDSTTYKIMYAYKVKYCNVKWGYNQRECVGYTEWSKNIYAVKRQALWIAIRYIIKNQKDAEKRRKNKNRRTNVRSKD